MDGADAHVCPHRGLAPGHEHALVALDGPIVCYGIWPASIAEHVFRGWLSGLFALRHCAQRLPWNAPRNVCIRRKCGSDGHHGCCCNGAAQPNHQPRFFGCGTAEIPGHRLGSIGLFCIEWFGQYGGAFGASWRSGVWLFCGHGIAQRPRLGAVV